MPVSEWLEYCADAMRKGGLAFGHGTENAEDEAAWLVSASLGLSPAELTAGLPVGPGQAERIKSLLDQRISRRVPLAYLLGEAWFCGHRFEVNEHVLVPRSPIAELIDARFNPWLGPGQVGRVLDLCTGSGALAVATALAFPAARVVASDISVEALEVAQRNAQLHDVSDRVSCVRSDLFDSLPPRNFDLILSNPPYVAENVFQRLPGEYHAEPELALVSAAGGLDIPLRIMRDAANYLSPRGVLICEVGESAEPLHRALPGVALTWIEFEFGGDGVFIMDREQLVMHRAQVESALEVQAHVV